MRVKRLRGGRSWRFVWDSCEGLAMFEELWEAEKDLSRHFDPSVECEDCGASWQDVWA
jgi:hypothetical protein